MSVVVENNEQILQTSWVRVPNNLIDADQMLIGEGGWQSGDGLNEVVGPLPRGRPTSRDGCEKRPGIEPSNLEGSALILILVDAAQLSEDLDANLRLLRDLVPERNVF